ncbi:MAG: hypothetical protein NC114_11520 [Ruminococcus flavefaciens]|nr:hypothetical protein [Ruminococcus flavefaciens]
MNKIYKYMMSGMLALVVAVGFTGCQKADEDFKHDNNLISDMRIKTNTAAEGIAGKITEYDAQGNVVMVSEYINGQRVITQGSQVTAAEVQGGHGQVEFILKRSLMGVYDPERCYLSASLTYSEIITPPLALHDICNRDSQGVAQGINITVTSGIGTKRVYNVIGYFEGEYVLTDDATE